MSRFSALAGRSPHRERRRTGTVAIRPPLKSAPTTALYWSWTLELASAGWQSRIPLATARIDILLTHLHMDHIQGLGFFSPLYDPGVDVHIWGPASSMLRLEARLSRYLSPPLFPVHLRDLPKVVCHEVPRPPFDIGPFRVRTALVCHPGPTVGYRIECSWGFSGLSPRP